MVGTGPEICQMVEQKSPCPVWTICQKYWCHCRVYEILCQRHNDAVGHCISQLGVWERCKPVPGGGPGGGTSGKLQG